MHILLARAKTQERTMDDFAAAEGTVEFDHWLTMMEMILGFVPSLHALAMGAVRG